MREATSLEVHSLPGTSAAAGAAAHLFAHHAKNFAQYAKSTRYPPGRHRAPGTLTPDTSSAQPGPQNDPIKAACLAT